MTETEAEAEAEAEQRREILRALGRTSLEGLNPPPVTPTPDPTPVPVPEHLPANAVIISNGHVYALRLQSYTHMDSDLEAARERLLADARRSALNITTEAEANAARIIQQAERRLAEADALRRQAAPSSPPLWAVNGQRILQYRAERWEILFDVQIQVTGFDFGRDYHIDAKTDADPIVLKLWMPVGRDGSFAATTIHAFDDKNTHPHISLDSSCMVMGDAPARITDMTTFNRTVMSLSRALGRVQLDSLYVSPKAWRRRFERFIPDNLNAVMQTRQFNNDIGAAMNSFIATGAVPREREEAAVWTAA